MFSLICLYLNNLGSKCNQATSCLFVKELALIWCGRELLEIISSFFICSRNLGFLFAVPNFTDGFMGPSNSEIKQNKCYCYRHVTELCSFEMVYDIALIYQRTVCFFTVVFGSGFRLKLRSVAMMASSRKCLLEDEIEQSFLDELTASDQSSCSDNDDSSGTNDVTS